MGSMGAILMIVVCVPRAYSLEPKAFFPCGSFSPIENRKAPPPPDVGSARPGLSVGRRKLARHGPSGLRRLMEACNVSERLAETPEELPRIKVTPPARG